MSDAQHSTNGAPSNGATTNGASSNGAATNGSAGNGASGNGAGVDGAGVTEPKTGFGGLDHGVLPVAMVVVLGAVMSILDVTVVNVAINELAKDFNSPLSTIQWVATGYTLALATVIPLTGWAADRFGTKRLYMISIGLFVLGSIASGFAQSAVMLIVFRVLQGFGGGMIMPAGMTILARTAGPQKMGSVMAIVGIPMMVGPILGPILGGFLVDSVSWRWIFFINIPVGIIGLLMAQRILPKDKPQLSESLDALGLALVSPGLALLIYGFTESNTHGGFGHPEVWGPVLAGVVLLIAFARHALSKSNKNPLIDLRLFKNPAFRSAVITMSLFIVAVFGAMLLLPLYLQVVRGESALMSGLLLAPQGIGAMITMNPAGRYVDRIGPGKIVLAGFPLVLLSFLGLTQVTESTSYWILGVELFLMGAGMGMTMMPIFSGAMQTLRHSMIARASTSLNIVQQVGASIGTALLSVLLASSLASKIPGADASEGLGAAQSIPPDQLAQIQPKIAEAFSGTFLWALVLLVIAVVPALFLPRSKPDPVEEPGPDPAAEPDEAVAEAMAGV